jgi:signal transduction histidine kinase
MTATKKEVPLGSDQQSITTHRPAINDLSEKAFRDLALRVVNAREEERSRLGRELHDDLSQQLALFAIELEQLRAMLPAEEDVRKQFQTLQDRVQEMAKDVHRLSYELHPSRLEHLGLGSAVKNLCRDVSNTRKLQVDYVELGAAITLSPQVRLCAFRVVQEALRNCTKHSSANSVRVELAHERDELRLAVADDGRGFDLASGPASRGLGFTSMRERIKLVDGRLEIRSVPGEGTLIEAWIPVTEAVEHVKSET